MTPEGHASRREFRLWVDGRLSGQFAAGFGDVRQREVEDGTLLTGAYVDEAHLHGVLDKLRGLGITVRRFEVADVDEEQNREQGPDGHGTIKES